MKDILRIERLNKSFKVGDSEIQVLNDINLVIHKGQLTILKGKSGSGKTTLMNMMSALDQPNSGNVVFEGQNMLDLGSKKRDEIRRTKVGFVFQSVALVSIMTAYENVELALRLANYPKEQRDERVKECLTLVGLGNKIHNRVHELSGGEQQRVGIARAIAHKPSIIFADEPTAELDSHTSMIVIKLLESLIQETNVTIVMTTHDPDLIDITDNVYTLVDGGIVDEPAV